MNHALTPQRAAGLEEPTLIDQAVRAIGQGVTVLLTTGRDAQASTLSAIGHRLGRTRARVLRLRPPLDLPAVMQQLAGARHEPYPAHRPFDALNALTVFDPACDRIVLLIEDGHLLPDATLRYLDVVLAATPTLHFVIAGHPDVARLLAAPERMALRQRPALHLAAPAPPPIRQQSMAAPLFPGTLRSEPRGRSGHLPQVALFAAAIAAAATFWMLADAGALPSGLRDLVDLRRNDPAQIAPDVGKPATPATTPNAAPENAMAPEVQDMPSRLAALQRRVAERQLHLAELQRQPAIPNVATDPDLLPRPETPASASDEPDNATPSGPSGMEPVSLRTTLSSAVAAHVVVTYVRGNQAAERQAAELAGSLRSKGIDTQGPEPQLARPADPVVGYFFAEDAATAFAVARDAGEPGRESLTTPQGAPPRPGTIRIVLKGNASPITGRQP